MRKIWLAAAVLFLRPLALRAESVSAPAQALAPAHSYQTGQIIAISEMRIDPSTLIFEALTGSRYGHVGVVAQTPEGPMVYHANPPMVQKTPLADFINRARVDNQDRPQLTILETIKPLSDQESRDLTAHMEDMVVQKVPYNYSMILNDKSVNCSEFVHKVFAAISRAGIGDIETLGNANFGAFDGAIAKLHSKWPPLDSPAISPLSVVSSPALQVVHAELPVDKIISDAEIFKAWQAGGGLEGFSNFTGISMQKLEALGQAASKIPYRLYPSHWRQPRTGQKT
jgi:hypothetical protein